MPRPRKSPTGEAATEEIRVYLSAAEKEQVQARAGTVSLSSYCLKAALGKRQALLTVPEVNRLAYLELGKIGSNLNQLVRSCHQAVNAGLPPSVDLQMIESLTRQVKELQLQVVSVAEEAVEP